MSARPPFSASHDHLVYLRVFEGCNLRCLHCFIPQNPKRMSLDDVARVPETVRSFAAPGSTVLLQWHGGEPTLLGADWLRGAVEAVHANGPDFAWVHGIQTNLTTYGPEWASLYRDHFGGEVGVSWDPGIRALANGGEDAHAAFERRFWANLERLVADGVEPYMVVTATRTFFEAFPNPLRFFDLLQRSGVRKAHIERLTETGHARGNWGRIGLSNAEFSRSMARFAKAYALWREADEGPRLFLSPFDGLMEAARSLLSGEAAGYGCWSGRCDTRFHTIDQSGYKRGCTALTSEVDNKRADSARALDIVNMAEARRERTIFHCSSCRYRAICSSGCLALSMDDGSGECSGGFRLFEAMAGLVARNGG